MELSQWVLYSGLPIGMSGICYFLVADCQV